MTETPEHPRHHAEHRQRTTPAHLTAVIGTDPEPTLTRLDRPSGLRQDAIGEAELGRLPLKVRVRGAGFVASSEGVSWSHSPIDRPSVDHLSTARVLDDAATLRLRTDGSVEVRTGISGAQGLFTTRAAQPDGAVVSSSAQPLVDAELVDRSADWDAWAHIIAAGGALGDRTPFRRVRRLTPTEALVVGTDGAAHIAARSWEWLAERPHEDGDISAIAEALDAAVARQASRSTLHILLSGGWDSRVLAILAARHDGDVDAWTISKDAGTAWEELIARKVARQLGLRHHLIQPDARRFEEDLQDYAELVGFQTPYHVWLLPLARRLGDLDGTVLDGLGGGVFFGGAFPPTVGLGSAQDRRFAQLIRYLRAAPGILRAETEAQLTERTRAAFDALTLPLMDHREVDALSAYLTRTLPGISLGPFGLVAGFTPVATPFLDHEVVTTSLAVPVGHRKDRALYPQLLNRWAPGLLGLRTAVEPPPQKRRRPIRSASRRTATALRSALVGHDVGCLLHPRLRRADVGTWQRQLESKAVQHVLRSLWLLSLWMDREQPDGDGPDVLARPTG